MTILAAAGLGIFALSASLHCDSKWVDRAAMFAIYTSSAVVVLSVAAAIVGLLGG